MKSAQYGDATGTISVKGRKFTATTPKASMWFNGQTLWTYMAESEEVHVTTPTDSQLQALNPYNFINMYKQGYAYKLSSAAKTHTVHLTATDTRRKVQEMFITMDRQSFVPSEVKLRQGSKWTTFTVSQFRTATLADGVFQFNAREYPSAEVVDLR